MSETSVTQQMLDNESYRHPAQGLEQFPPQMTLRDWFAGMALSGGLSHMNCVECHSVMVPWAYDYADAMMKQREVTNEA